MSDLKFSCPQCGQHIACGPEWAGHTLECPACHTQMTAPQLPAAPAPTAPVSSAPPPSSPASRPAGVRMAAASSSPRPAPAATSARKPTPRPPTGDNSLLKYGFSLLLVVALGSAAYYFIAPMVKKGMEASEDTGSAPARTGGPMGEMNEAMDVSDALDGGGSSAPRPRPRPTTNSAPRPRR